MTEKEEKIIEFISTFEMYDKEESGIKPNTLRELTIEKEHKLSEASHIRIRRAYTLTTFVRKITDKTKWGKQWIISWNPNVKATTLNEPHEPLQEEFWTISQIKKLGDHLTKQFFIRKEDYEEALSQKDKEIEELKEKIEKISFIAEDNYSYCTCCREILKQLNKPKEGEKE